jgi:hypothetical protein
MGSVVEKPLSRRRRPRRGPALVASLASTLAADLIALPELAILLGGTDDAGVFDYRLPG